MRDLIPIIYRKSPVVLYCVNYPLWDHDNGDTLNTCGYPNSERPMTLSELLGDEPLQITAEERKFLEHAKSLWARQFDQIIRESRGPKVKTRIHVKKARKNER